MPKSVQTKILKSFLESFLQSISDIRHGRSGGVVMRFVLYDVHRAVGKAPICFLSACFMRISEKHITVSYHHVLPLRVRVFHLEANSCSLYFSSGCVGDAVAFCGVSKSLPFQGEFSHRCQKCANEDFEVISEVISDLRHESNGIVILVWYSILTWSQKSEKIVSFLVYLSHF